MVKKKLIIVYDKATEATANYLLQMISGNDDTDGAQTGTKDGELDANIWSEKEYANNRPKLSSAQYVLFIGNSRTAKTMRENVADTFCEAGMHYGWLGTQAFMYVDAASLNKDNMARFQELCEQYSKHFEKKFDMQYSPNEKNFFVGMYNRVGDIFRSKDAEKQQYTLLATIMYMDGLTAFLGE
ncbi:MAG: hypothetical protein E7622_01840 [Ruminococcaceae bacterium]|nr:hypothetical protein [Oscillospiraceae bacterium]